MMKTNTTRNLFFLSLTMVCTVMGTVIGGCGDDDGSTMDATVEQDATASDAQNGDATSVDASLPKPEIHVAVNRHVPGSTQRPDVLVTVTVSDSEGEPVDGTVSMSAENPEDLFDPHISEITSNGDGTHTAVVTSSQTGEVRISAEAEVEGQPVTAAVTVVFLEHLSENWSIPISLSELNTMGHEDSIAISPDGQTLFFSYTPLVGCAAPEYDWSDACRFPVGPTDSVSRPQVFGIDGQGQVTEGLYGSTDDPPSGWPFTKQLYNSYAAYRDAGGAFSALTAIGFEDDGVLTEVSPSSGSENPTVGEPYNLFIGYPDWLNFDGDTYAGTVFAVVSATAGEHAVLGGPITSGGAPPPNMMAQRLTGPINTEIEANDIGEFRVFWDPALSNHELYLEMKPPEEDSDFDILISPLTGEYPVGDWGAPQALSSPINTSDHHEIFPWPVMLTLSEGFPIKHLFFSRSPVPDFSSPSHIMVSRWENESWSEPDILMTTDNSFGQGTIFVSCMPAVSQNVRGTEMFFVYSVVRTPPPDIVWNHQIAVSRRLEN